MNNTENTKALYEIAQALNRLTLLKAIELHAASIRENGVLMAKQCEGDSSIQKVEYALF